MTEPDSVPADPGLETGGADHEVLGGPRSPWSLFWRQFRRSQIAVAGGALLLVLYGLALFAPFVSPYAPETMDRQRFYHPPQRLHWVDATGRLHAWPFVHPTHIADPEAFRYEEDRGRITPLQLFAHGARYRLFGLIRARWG